MTDRSVIVRLKAVTSDYTAAMNRAGQATTKFGADLSKGVKQGTRELGSVSTESTLVGAALLGIGVAAVAAATTFDKQMSGVGAVAGATATQMGQLRQAALDAGQATVFSASEAAKAEAELAKAGVKTADILGGALSGSLSLAAAGQIDLASAATISAQAMNTFGLKGKDVSHIADVLAAGANKSAADVGQLGDALRQGGLVAKQTGLSLEDTVGVLSAFSDQALIGSDAGTSLKTLLQRLIPTSEAAATTMEDLGIQAYDAGGNFIGLSAYAQKLKDGLSGLSDEQQSTALTTLYGSDAVRAASVLYDLGAKGVDEYTRAVDDQGAASRMASAQLDNLAGDFEQLSGSIETTFIKSGTQANGVLRETVQVGTEVVNFLGDVPGPILGVTVGVTALSGAFFIAAPRIATFNAQLAASPGLAKAATIGLKGLGAVTAVAVFAGFIMDARASDQATNDLIKSIADLRTSLSQGFKSDDFQALNDKVAELRDQLTAAQNPGLVDTMQDLGNLLTNTDYVSPVQKLSAALRDASVSAGDVNSGIGNAAGALGITFTDALDLANEGGIAFAGTSADITDAIVEYGKAQSVGGVATRKSAKALDVLGDSTASVEDQLKALKDQWDATTGAMLGTSDATIAAEAALADMTQAIKDNGKTFDIHTEQGRANQSQINDSIRAFEDMRIQAIETGDGSAEATKKANDKMVDYLTTLRDRLPPGAKAARAQVQKLIDKFKEVPPKKSTTLTVNVNGALSDIHSVAAYWASTVAWINSHPADARAHYSGVAGAGNSVPPPKVPPPPAIPPHGAQMAGGGEVHGPGTGTSDSVHGVSLSNGEFVTQAAIAQAHRPLMHAINAGNMRAAAAYLGGAAGSSFSIGQLNVQAAPGEWAAESVPRSLRREAFLLGVGG